MEYKKYSLVLWIGSGRWKHRTNEIEGIAMVAYSENLLGMVDFLKNTKTSWFLKTETLPGFGFVLRWGKNLH